MSRGSLKTITVFLALGASFAVLPLSAQCPPQADSLAVRTKVAIRFESWPAADSLSTKMTLNFPGCPESFLARGLFLYAARRASEARDALDQVLALEPGHVQALKLRGMCEWTLQDWDGALSDMDRVLASSSDPEEQYQARALRASIHLERDDLDSALQEAEAMIALNPDYPDAYGVRAQVWEEREEWNQRAADLVRVLEREQEAEVRVATLVALGATWIELGHLAEARASLDEAARLDAAAGRIYFYRAKVNQLEGHLAEARADLRLAIVAASSAEHRQEAQQLLTKLGAGS